MISLPLDKLSIVVQGIDICDYLGYSNSDHTVCRLYLDPHKYDQPPLLGEPVSKNPQWIQLKDALEAAAHTSGSPIMCNGGNAYRRQIQMMQALQLRVYNKSRFPKNKSDAPQQDNRINMDRGAGRRPEGRSRSKVTSYLALKIGRP